MALDAAGQIEFHQDDAHFAGSEARRAGKIVEGDGVGAEGCEEVFAIGGGDERRRARGGRGWFGWIRKLPWDDPSVTAQILAMIGFTLGGLVFGRRARKA